MDDLVFVGDYESLPPVQGLIVTSRFIDILEDEFSMSRGGRNVAPYLPGWEYPFSPYSEEASRLLRDGRIAE